MDGNTIDYEWILAMDGNEWSREASTGASWDQEDSREVKDKEATQVNI